MPLKQDFRTLPGKLYWLKTINILIKFAYQVDFWQIQPDRALPSKVYLVAGRVRPRDWIVWIDFVVATQQGGGPPVVAGNYKSKSLWFFIWILHYETGNAATRKPLERFSGVAWVSLNGGSIKLFGHFFGLFGKVQRQATFYWPPTLWLCRPLSSAKGNQSMPSRWRVITANSRPKLVWPAIILRPPNGTTATTVAQAEVIGRLEDEPGSHRWLIFVCSTDFARSHWDRNVVRLKLPSSWLSILWNRLKVQLLNNGCICEESSRMKTMFETYRYRLNFFFKEALCLERHNSSISSIFFINLWLYRL